MEFNLFDHNRFVSHPSNHHRDIHRHNFPPAPPFHLPPAPPPLYSSLPLAPPPPPPPQHSNFTFMNESPRLLSGRVPDPYPMTRPERVEYNPSGSYNCDSDYINSVGFEFIDGYRDGNVNVNKSQIQRSLWNDRNDDVANYRDIGYKFETRDLEFRNENRENLSYESRYGNVLENERFLNDNRESRRSVDWERDGSVMDLMRRARDRERERERERELERISIKEREEREENFHTPNKKSVLLRIGKPNDVRYSRSYEKNLSGSRGKGKAKEKEKGKDGVVFPKFRIEDEKERSPVDLDVSFKSNGLVANVSPGKRFTPKRRKGRKGNAFNSPKTKLVEHSVRLASTIHVRDSPSRSEKTPVKVEDNTVFGALSVAKSSADTSSAETLKKIESVIVSGSGSGTKGAESKGLKRCVQDTVSDKSHEQSGFRESPSYKSRKKKKVASVPLHASHLELKKESEFFTLDNSTHVPLLPIQGVMHMNKKINSIVIKHDDIVSLSSPNVLNVNKLDAVPQTIVSDMDNVASKAESSILPDVTTKRSLHLLDSLFSQENKLDKDTSIPCGSDKMYVPVLDNVGTECQHEYNLSGLAREKDRTKEPCKNGKDISLENGLCNGSSAGIMAGCNHSEHGKVSASEFGFRSTAVSNIDLIDAGAKQSVLIENNILLPSNIQEACLGAADISIELSRADANKVEFTEDKRSSYCDPSSPSSSECAITVIEGDKIVSCPVGDIRRQISLTGTNIHVNAVVGNCPNAEVPTFENQEVCSGMVYPNVKRKRYTEQIQSDLSGARTCDKHLKVNEDNVISCSLKEVLVKNEVSSCAGNLHAASQNFEDGDICAQPNEISLEVGVVRTGTNVDPDGACPFKKIKVFHNDDGKTASGGASVLIPNISLNNFKEEKKELVNDKLINSNNASVPSQDTHTIVEALKPSKGDLTLTRKKPTSAVPRVFTSPSSLNLSNSKRATPLNHNAKSRSWHRPGTLIASMQPVNKTFSPPVSASRISPKKAGKVQGSSYIRKGNSLVRKPSTVSAIPYGSPACTVYQLNSSGKDDIRKSSWSGNKTGINGSASWLRTRDGDENCKSSRPDSMEVIANSASHLITGGLVATSEGTKIPPLPQINKLKDTTSIHAGDCTPSPLENSPSDSCPEASLTPLQQTPNVDIPNILEDDPKLSGTSEHGTGLNSDLENERVLDKGKSGERITYVKRKSNQLIATRNVNDISNQDADKLQVLPSDSYYKRRKNQLIRASTENHNMRREVPASTVNSERKRISSNTSGGSLSKRHFNKVWRLGKTHSPKKVGSSLREKSVLFPWKRTVCWQNSIHNTPYTSTNNSLTSISQKLLFSRKRDTIYTRSRRGFSLRISKLLSVGGSSLKWSKSIEKNSKRANEEATLAVAAVQKKKRDQKNARVVPGTKSRNKFSRERIFRIGSLRYKMDPTRRTLQRISDVEASCSPTSNSEKNVKKSYVPRRLVIGNDEYVRIGNGNQLIRDPKKRTRALASEKVRWSLHTARLRLARKSKYCQFFTRFGKCNKDDGKCPYIHDHSKIAVCTKYLSGSCTSLNCKLTHKVIPERMQDCSYYQQGSCSNHSCPYRHVNVNANASICEGFLKGYCDDGNECRKKHTYVCPKYEETGICPQGSKCKLHHPKKRSKGLKRKLSRGKKNAHGRYFGSRSFDTIGSITAGSEKLHLKNSDDIFNLEGKFTDYISLDISDEEAGETVDPLMEQITMCASDVQVADLDEQIKPVGVMHRLPTADPSLIIDSLG
ncbi:uncharacterized protein LOC141671079 isoform X2 [Apium graveolens]|uniref:uncharacterized protein LOC141671079 isoform X2 n=1 Tax=Apium graveolens TaxID=4045 RepID=UPI003D799C4F